MNNNFLFEHNEKRLTGCSLFSFILSPFFNEGEEKERIAIILGS